MLQGDPSAVPYAVENVRAVIGKKPVFGICMGHQLLGQAFGGTTFKLKFGHHGGNHPIRFEETSEPYSSSDPTGLTPAHLLHDTRSHKSSESLALLSCISCERQSICYRFATRDCSVQTAIQTLPSPEVWCKRVALEGAPD